MTDIKIINDKDYESISQKSKLINPAKDDFDISKLVFGQIQIKTIPNDTKTYKSIKMFYEHTPGKYHHINLATPPMCYSFGISANTNPKTGVIESYTLPLCVYNTMMPTEPQKKFKAVFDGIVQRCKDFLLLDTTKEDIGRENLSYELLTDIASSMTQKKDEVINNRGIAVKKINDKSNFVFYVKLKTSRAKNGDSESEIKNQTIFSEATENGFINTTDIALGKYLNRRIKVSAVIAIDSIYIGGSYIRIQFKVREANVYPITEDNSRLLQYEVSDNDSENDNEPLLERD